MRRGIGRLRAGGGGNEAAAWAAAVTANGGTYSAGTLTAVTNFVASAKASGYWGKLLRINLFCGDQLAAALVPLKTGGGNATDTNVNFVGGDYTEATGLTGNAATKYLNTGLVANTLAANDTHLSVYNRSASGTGGGVAVGAFAAAGSIMNLYAPFSDATAYSDQYDAASGRINAVPATPYGHIVGSRSSAAAHSLYRNASSLASSATSGGTLPAFPLFVFATNSAGSPGTFSGHNFAAYSIGSGLSASDVTAFNTHMQAFQTALSRNV